MKLQRHEIAALYDRILAKVMHKYDDMQIARIVQDHYLLPDGAVRQCIEVSFRNDGQQPLATFDWHLPLITPEMQVYGLRAQFNQHVVGFVDTRFEADEFHLLQLELSGVKKNVSVHAKFEFIIIDAYEESRRAFVRTRRYPFVFVPAATVRGHDFWIHSAGNFEPEVKVDVEGYRAIKIEDGKHAIVTTSHGRPRMVQGDIEIRHYTRYREPLITFIAGAVLTAAFVVPSLWPDAAKEHPTWFLAGSTVAVAVVVTMVYRLLRKG